MKYSLYADTYCYKDNPDILINNFNIRNKQELAIVEQKIVEEKLNKLLSYPQGNYNLQHLQLLHKYLFGDIYPWAGELRTVDISKDNTPFCKPQYIVKEYNKLYENYIHKNNYLKDYKKSEIYKHLSYYHGEINIIHPFREGNGRTTRALLSLLTNNTHDLILNYNCLNNNDIIQASKDSVFGNYTLMDNLYKKMINSSQSIKKDINIER